MFFHCLWNVLINLWQNVCGPQSPMNDHFNQIFSHAATFSTDLCEKEKSTFILRISIRDYENVSFLCDYDDFVFVFVSVSNRFVSALVLCCVVMCCFGRLFVYFFFVRIPVFEWNLRNWSRLKIIHMYDCICKRCGKTNQALNEFAVIYFYVSKWSTSMSTDDDVDDRADADSCFDFLLMVFSSLLSK